MQQLQQPVAAVASAPVVHPAAIIPLSRPIQGHQGQISEIRLSEPTFGDWLDCGEFEKHYLVGDMANAALQKIEVSVDVEAVGRWFQRLSGLHVAVLAQMPLGDSRVVYQHLQRLAGSRGRANPPMPQTNYGSSAV